MISTSWSRDEIKRRHKARHNYILWRHKNRVRLSWRPCFDWRKEMENQKPYFCSLTEGEKREIVSTAYLHNLNVNFLIILVIKRTYYRTNHTYKGSFICIIISILFALSSKKSDRLGEWWKLWKWLKRWKLSAGSSLYVCKYTIHQIITVYLKIFAQFAIIVSEFTLIYFS